MRTKFLSRLALFLLAVSGPAYEAAAQLSGVKTIPGDFPSIATAIDALNQQGAGAGGLTFDIAAGYTETAANLTITTTATDAARPVVFRKAGAGTNPTLHAAPGSGSMDGIIRIAGADYIAFEGLDLRESPANTNNTSRMEWGFALLRASGTNGSRHIAIRNCNIVLNQSNPASCGIYSADHTVTASNSIAITAESGTNSFNSFGGNTILNCYNGIYLNGHFNSSFHDNANVVGENGGNFIHAYGGGTTTASGIYAANQRDILIENNDISHQASTAASVYGICNRSSGQVWITGNAVTISSGTASGHTVTAIDNLCSGPSSEIRDNRIYQCDYDQSGMSSYFYGIRDQGVPTAANPLRTVSGNRIENNSMNRGHWYGIYEGVSNGRAVIGSNTISGNSKESGHMVLILSLCKDAHVHNNELSSDSLRSGTPYASTLHGIYLGSPAAIAETLRNNRVRDLYLSSNADGYLRGLCTDNGTATVKTIQGNEIRNLTAIGGQLAAIWTDRGAVTNICNNNVYSLLLREPAAAMRASAIVCAAGTTNVYNNFISDLRSAFQNVPVVLAGLISTGGDRLNLYHNTIYLDGTGGSAPLRSAAVMATGGSTLLDLRNNIFVNRIIPTGGARSTALMGSRPATLLNYSSTSNNNLLYAGLPDNWHSIYDDSAGAAPLASLSAFQQAVRPADSASVTELPPFVNTTALPYDLRFPPGLATAAANGRPIASSLPGMDRDFFGNARSANAPYMGAFEGNPGIAAGLPGSLGVRRWSATVNAARTITLRCDADRPGAATIQMFSLNGQPVLEGAAGPGERQLQLPSSTLPAGLYLLSIHTAGTVEVLKVNLP